MSLVLLASLVGLALPSCPFQAPLAFLDKPKLQPVLDEFGNASPDKVSSIEQTMSGTKRYV